MSVVSTGLEVVGSFEVAVIRGSFGFECFFMSFARLADASTASFVGWVFSSFCDDKNGVTRVTDPFDSEPE